MLQNPYTYRELKHDPTRYIASLDNILMGGVCMGVINDKQKEFLIVSASFCLIFHAFSKMHMDTFPPSFHPIIAG